MERKEEIHEVFGEVISSYTRKQAIDDGVLVDVSEIAREAGFRFPVSMTRTVWNEYVEVPPGVRGQDENGRLWDILWMLRVAIRNAKGSEIRYQLYVRNDNRKARLVTLKALCGPSDTGEPVITIMMPDED